MKAGVLTVSDRCSRGEATDASGTLLVAALLELGLEVPCHAVVPDDADEIAATLTAWCGYCTLIVTTGGTGFAPLDVTPEATRRVVERDAPGLAEMLRWHGYQHNPRAALSRGVAGIRGSTLIVNLPGSVRAVQEGVDVLEPVLPHALAVLTGQPLDH